MKFNKSRLIFGGLVLGCLVLGFSWWVNSLRQELHFIENATLLKVADLATLETEQTVLMTGIISSDNPPLYQDLVVGVQEQYYSGEDGGWEVEQDPEARINVEIEADQKVSLFIENPYPKGSYQTFDFGNTRWRGYTAGSLITSFAMVNQREPLLFEAIKHYGGTQTQYVQNLKSSLSAARFVAAMLMGICGVVMFWPERKRHKKTELEPKS